MIKRTKNLDVRRTRRKSYVTSPHLAPALLHFYAGSINIWASWGGSMTDSRSYTGKNSYFKSYVKASKGV